LISEEPTLQDLISFLQTNRAGKREDTAGNVLAALLREKPGQAVIRKLLDRDAASGAINVNVRGKHAGSFPDIRLHASGSLIGILELKFDAGLTEAQLNGVYKDGCPRAILIVPENRIEELEKEHRDSFHLFRSWEWLINELDHNFHSDGENDHFLHLSTIAHLKEFCKIMEQSTFNPFTSEQLRQSNGEFRKHITWLVTEIVTRAETEELVSIKPPKTLKWSMFEELDLYGRYVLLGDQEIWIGYWAKAWIQHSTSGPLWVDLLKSRLTSKNDISLFSIDDKPPNSYPLLTAADAAPSSQDEVEHALSELRKLKLAFYPE
jgi:hypothetical protein